MKSKSTKRALLSSLFTLFICFAMLLGTTFAWFTDSASSATNKIVAGNLDVELYHADKAQPTDELVGSTTKLFDDVTLWEPGAMVWEKLTVKNNGSLALKYTLSVNIESISEVNGKSLADVLKVAVLTEEPTRENVAAAATQPLATFNLESDKALTKDASDVVYVAIYWEPSAKDNDYNVAGGALNATLGVTLVATQYTEEFDSFNNLYDEDATYPELADVWDGTVDTEWYDDAETELIINTAEELAAFAAQVNSGNTFAGKTVKLIRDVNLNNLEWTPIGEYDGSKVFSGTFNGDAHIISNLKITKTDNTSATLRLGLFSHIMNATVENVVLDTVNIVANSANARATAFIMTAEGTNTIKDITVKNAVVDVTSTNNSGYAAGVVGYANQLGDKMSNINVSGLSLNVSASNSAFASAINGYLVQDDKAKEAEFKNVLDGFTVNDVVMSAKGIESYVGGAYGYCQKGSMDIKNGTITNLKITSQANNGNDAGIGGLVGLTYKVDHQVSENIVISNIDVDFTGTGTRVGGVTGYDQSVSDYKNVTVSGTINENITTGSGSEIGGFVGISFYYPKTYVDCSADVDVVTGGVAGGFVGTSCTNGWMNQTDAYTSCVARGDVTSDVAGGFAGKAWLRSNTTMAMTEVECYGAVTGKIHAGGMIGYAGTANNNVVIKDSVASQTVTGTVSSTTLGEIFGAGDATVTVE